jgi:hypothetical protein
LSQNKFVITQAGPISVEESAMKTANYFIGELIYYAQKGIKNGGFEKRDVMGMMITWLRIGQYLRNDQYARYHWVIFVREAAPPKGKKASQALLIALQRLEGYPAHAGADPHAVYFVEAEKAMATFISEYRKVLKQIDPETLEYFIGQLQRIAQVGRV